MRLQDIGYFVSPRERSYDALGLMKQLSEHTASAYANAREILGDETPDSILKKRFSEKREKIHQQGSSNILVCSVFKFFNVLDRKKNKLLCSNYFSCLGVGKEGEED